MRAVRESVERWTRSAGSRQFARFILVGVLNTAFSYLVYAALLLAGLNFALANLGAVLLGILFSFRTQGALVFSNSSPRLIFRYAAFWLIIYLCNIGLIKLLLSFGLNAYVAGALALPPIVLLSYVVQKYLVFADASSVEPPADKRNAN